MQYRHFGTTDLIVSEVGIGCTRLGGVFQGAGKPEVLALLRSAFEHGVNFFDTADIYAQGESEALLGEAFRKDRDKVIIASKVGYRLPTQKRLVSKIKPALRPLVQRLGLKRQHIPTAVRGTVSQDFSPTYIMQAVEQSLRRLGTEYIDLYQLHSPPPAVLRSGDFLEPLERLRRQGKVRYLGVSCDSPEDALVCLRYPEVSSIQVGLSLLEQDAANEAVPRASERGVALVARQVFASGLLAKPVAVTARAGVATDPGVRADQAEAITRYQRMANQCGRSLPEMALQFVLGTAGISVTLIGVRTLAHWHDSARFLAAPRLSHDELSALRRAGSV